MAGPASAGAGAVGEDAADDGGEGLEPLERQSLQQRVGPGFAGGHGVPGEAAVLLLWGEWG